MEKCSCKGKKCNSDADVLDPLHRKGESPTVHLVTTEVADSMMQLVSTLLSYRSWRPRAAALGQAGKQVDQNLHALAAGEMWPYQTCEGWARVL